MEALREPPHVARTSSPFGARRQSVTCRRATRRRLEWTV